MMTNPYSLVKTLPLLTMPNKEIKSYGMNMRHRERDPQRGFMYWNKDPLTKKQLCNNDQFGPLAIVIGFQKLHWSGLWEKEKNKLMSFWECYLGCYI